MGFRFFTAIFNFLLISQSVSAMPLRHDWIRIGCTLRTPTGEKKPFPGHMCIFQDDGSFISASAEAIRKFSKKREIIWEVPGNFHHQMNISPDNKRILALASEVTQVDNRLRRHDSVVVLDQDGKIIAKISSDEILKLAGIEPMKGNSPVFHGDYESSHFNSVYEIPENRRQKEISWVKQGNIIINGLFHGIFVFSPDLKTLHQHVRFHEGPKGHSIHDVQVSPDGNLLFFNNHASDGTKKTFSAIQKMDPRNKKIVFEYTAHPKEMFYSEGGGGVQEIGDYIFISHSLTGGFLYSKKNRDIVNTYPQNTGTTLSWIQDMKMIDATEFLKNSL